MMLEEFLPVLGDSVGPEFNVFDVMHHGTHEKQLSNVFGWLLDAGGTHGLGEGFVRIFAEEVNQRSPEQLSLPLGGYAVRQEVDTSSAGEAPDIADLVLERADAGMVIENYFTSDGHGHDYARYLDFARRGGRQGVVILLCRDEDESRRTMGWQGAVVLTYQVLIVRLYEDVGRLVGFQEANAQAHWFIEQLYLKFGRGTGLASDDDVLDFVAAMCQTGEARRYQSRPYDAAAEHFASDLAVQARQRFAESRELLLRFKERLRSCCAGSLRMQLESALGDGCLRTINGRYAGIYQWTLALDLQDVSGSGGSSGIQIKFGPSAWFANEHDREWRVTVPEEAADYSHLFLTNTDSMEIRQSSVTMRDVLNGLDDADTRISQEILDLIEGREPVENPSPDVVVSREFYERAVQALEDRMDTAAAAAARREKEPPVSHEDLMREQGL